MSKQRTPPWQQPNPVKPAARTRLTPAQIAEAKAAAEAAGRAYPNLIDNMRVVAKAHKRTPKA